MPRLLASVFLSGLLATFAAANAADGNRLAYLDGPLDPYYPHRDFPKLITPQWVGEEGVECVVTLAIDDMRDTAKYEAFLRPILNRLLEIDGRAPVSIMSCRVDPADPQLQTWLKEGLSIEVHTYDHPCPCLQDGGLAKAKETYDKCVDLMNQIPGNKPVAFRMPCCDSKNTPSPRFWAEVFNKTTEKGNFLQIDSSVFNIITNKDKELPKEITELPDGSERFRRYVPFTNFVNTIEDYPYPYVIGGMCWEFPCVVPSDWSANHVQKPNNPDTLRDWKLALDACVLKQGTFNLVFHPHGWIKAEQIVELIEHAVKKHGKKVKFLTFKECAERLNKNSLLGQSIRDSSGSDACSRVVDLDSNGLMDVMLFQGNSLRTILATENGQQTKEIPFATNHLDSPAKPETIHFGGAGNHCYLLTDCGFFDFQTGVGEPGWLKSRRGQVPADVLEAAKWAQFAPITRTNGFPNILIVRPTADRDALVQVFGEAAKSSNFIQFSVAVPLLKNPNAMRLVDVNKDGSLDLLYSDVECYYLYLHQNKGDEASQPGRWTTKVFDVIRGKEDAAKDGNKIPAIPPFVRADGTNNGAWFHSGALWMMNEDTWRLPDNVFKLTLAEMLAPLASDKKASGGREAPDNADPPTTGKQSKSEANSPSDVIGRLTPPARRAIEFVANQLAGPSFDDLEMTKPLSPEESLKAMHVRPGMKVELVAAEPLIVDPVAFDWGPDGRLWVVEMRDYPNGITWKKEGDEFGVPGGRVKVLTDVDGDGRYDKAAVFLDNIPFPTGVKVWRKGILVTAAPDILYAEDKDGDDKADEQKVLYRGFGEGNQQHRVNGLRWGLDNWLYVGNGDSGGVIRSLTAGLTPLPLGEGGRRPGEGGAATPAAGAINPHPSPLPKGEGAIKTEVNVAGRDLRIRPDTGELDAVSGNTQFGRERDDWGNWFGNNNSDPLWHYTLDDYYLRRNPNTTYPSVKKQVSVAPGAAPVFPRSKTLKRFNDDNKANRYTSACGQTFYRDDLLGPEFYGNTFVCEPVHNLVSREIVTPQGSTFTSKRATDEQQSEFLASEDSWFRPSMCRTGPDGALWVSDMYRFVIEHPKWIPEAAQKKLDLRAGDDKGRIYRIYPEGQQPRPIARLDKLDTAGLVAALDSPNGTQRDLAQQMILWRDDKAAVEPLKKLVVNSNRPQTRLQALSALDGLNSLADETLLQAFNDQHPAQRRHAIRLSESRLGRSADVAAAVLKLTNDSDVQVRIQVAYTLGQSSEPSAAPALAALLTALPDDVYLTAAALSSVNKGNVAGILAATLTTRPDSAATERLLAMAAAMGQDSAIRQALSVILKPHNDGASAWQFSTVSSLATALDRRKIKFASLLDDSARGQLAQLLGIARKAAADSTNESLAIAATSILARGLDEHDTADLKLLAALLAPQKQPLMRSTAVTALTRTGRKEVPELLLAGWNAHSPALRSQVIDSLAAREDWSLALLASVDAGQVPASQFDARRRQQFITSRSKTVRDKAEKILAGTIDTNRQKLVETYLASVTGTAGDAARGKTAFAKRCANCHKLEGAGHAVGPDLSPLTHKPLDYLLTAVLDPNRAVEDRYLEYVALTTDGRQLTGILLEETGASLTLAAPEGKKLTIPRGELEQIKSSGKSLMPEGIERDVPPAEMTDILAYLKQAAPAPKQLALNQPEVVQPFNDGSIRLFATNCRAYGPTIKMEETYRALGWWNSQEDHCVWSFDVPPGKAGDYRVTLEYSCDDNSAGNTVVLEANGQSLTSKVAGSGGWDKYRGWNLGTLNLAEGRGELVVRSSGPIKNALFDLGGIRLVPTK